MRSITILLLVLLFTVSLITLAGAQDCVPSRTCLGTKGEYTAYIITDCERPYTIEIDSMGTSTFHEGYYELDSTLMKVESLIQ